MQLRKCSKLNGSVDTEIIFTLMNIDVSVAYISFRRTIRCIRSMNLIEQSFIQMLKCELEYIKEKINK
jgi:hypothetical protein